KNRGHELWLSKHWDYHSPQLQDRFLIPFFSYSVLGFWPLSSHALDRVMTHVTVSVSLAPFTIGANDWRASIFPPTAALNRPLSDITPIPIPGANDTCSFTCLPEVVV